MWKKTTLGNISNIKIYQPQTIKPLNFGKYKVFGANGYIGYYEEYNHNTNQVTISCRGEKSGTVNFVEPFVWITGNSMVLNLDKTSEIIKKFLYYELISNNVNYLITGSGQPQLTRDSLIQHKIYFPNIDEQTEIANFLSLIDKRIELQNKIIKDYKLLKKELNNKLFCSINNSTPKIRFKNFYEKWAKNKVKNIFESVTRGYALSKKDISTIKTNTFKYPVYSSQTLNNGLLGYYSNYLYENAITWTTDGANAGEVNFRKDKFYCTNVCGVLLSNNGYCNECMAAIINKVTKKFVSLVGNPKLMNNVMENIEIIFPSNIKEQLKISIFLSTIDKIIALYKDAINLYKKQKSFFLSKLFI